MRRRSIVSAAASQRLAGFAASAVGALAVLSFPPTTALAEAAETAKTTLTGDKLRAPALSPEAQASLELDLKIAQAVFEVAPDREDSYIWLGRRYAYLGRFDEAIAVFTAGLEKFPDSYKLLRFRGRKLARSRDFNGAVADYRLGLEKMQGVADSFEPDGAPNARGLTIGTYWSNLHYYLGQTCFATGDYRCMIEHLELSTQSPIALPIEDHKVAVALWKYMALMKLGDKREARRMLMSVPAKLDLVENHFYHRAVMVLQGRVAEAEVLETGDSLAKFSLAMKKRFEGDSAGARAILVGVVRENALGYWPAEAEILRIDAEG